MAIATSFEQDFWQFNRQFSADSDITPLNLEEQKTLFFKALQAGVIIQPEFVYTDRRADRRLDSIDRLSARIDELDEPYKSIYQRMLEDMQNWASCMDSPNRQHSQQLYEVFGSPDNELVTAALEQLAKPAVQAPSESSLIPDAAEYFHHVLEKFGFDDWKIVEKSMPSRARVAGLDKTIYIDPNATFNEDELARLSVHEIGTHVLRLENGSTQDSLLYMYGFPAYIECEEGLAIYSEQVSNLLSEQDMRKYCLRVVAASLAEHCSFAEVYENLAQHTDPEMAYAITVRVKRGLNNTDEPYGYSKDQVYFSGFRKVQKLNTSQLHSLYLGKLGFAQLGTSFTQGNTSAITIPEWIDQPE